MGVIQISVYVIELSRRDMTTTRIPNYNSVPINKRINANQLRFDVVISYAGTYVER